MKTSGIIHFREDYSKLYKSYFSTIRLKDKGLNVGETYTIKSPSMEFKAQLIIQGDIYVSKLSENILCTDTDTDSIKEALEVLRGFYPDLSENDPVKVYWFRKVKEEEEG